MATNKSPLYLPWLLIFWVSDEKLVTSTKTTSLYYNLASAIISGAEAVTNKILIF
jgi:hypothetical protein